MASPSFEIPARPRRYYPYGGGVEYEGGTVFSLSPDTELDLTSVVESLLSAGPYRFGDFLDLPMPLWLVRDEGTGDVFRVVVRNGSVRLHVLPETDPDGLRRFYERLCERAEADWAVDRDMHSP